MYMYTTIAMIMMIIMTSSSTPPTAPPAIGPTDGGLPLFPAADKVYKMEYYLFYSLKSTKKCLAFFKENIY